MASGLIPIAAIISRRLGAVARPRSDRWNPRPVPALGGIALVGGMASGLVAGLTGTPELLPIVGGAAIICALGLSDDLGHVSPRIRLLVQAVVGAAFAFLVSSDLDPRLRTASVALAAIAVPTAINATNMVDNVDGLAATLSTITGLSLLGIAVAAGLPSAGPTTALIVSAACLAFLRVNWPSARMFMGDVGSLTIGFVLAAATILMVRDALVTVPNYGLAIVLLLPLAWSLQLGDLMMVSVGRIRRGVSPLRGGLDHTSHRLLAMGIRPRMMLAFLGLFGVSIGTAATGAAVVAEAWLSVALVCLMVLIVGGFELAVVRRSPATARTTDLSGQSREPG